MRKFITQFVLFSLASLFVISLSGNSVLAAKSFTPFSTILGNDISWPQCNKTYPKGQTFGIVGVNGGLANNNNPCFASQLLWAQQSKGGTGQDNAALYVNTANPGLAGTWWPDSNDYGGSTIANPYGTCDHADSRACAYIYGYAKAYDDATIRGVDTPSSYVWWLDVETINSWESNKVANAADLEGMTAYFQSIGARVGLYSTSYQWGKIVGTVDANSDLNYLQSWIPGARNQSSAQANCSVAPLTTGSPVTLTQFIANRLDYNFSCI